MGDYGGGSTVIQAPAAPDYTESMESILAAQVKMAPEVYASEAKYQPLYGALQAAQQAFQTQQSLNIARQSYPQIAEMEAAYNQANRAAELGQLQTALPAYQQAFNALTPGYAQAVANAGQLAQSATAQALNRPVFSAYQNAVRDPYGAPMTLAQPRMVSMAQPQAVAPTVQQQPMQPYVPQTAGQTPAPPIQLDQGLADRFKQFSTDLRNALPGVAAAPTNPGAPIAPTYAWSRGRGQVVSNQGAIDAQNAKIAQYKTDLAAFNEAEAKRQANMSGYLANFDPAAALAPQQPAQGPTFVPGVSQGLLTAEQFKAQQAQQPSLASGALQVQGNLGPISAERPGMMLGQRQGPADNIARQIQNIPSAQQAYSNLQETPAGGYVNAVRGFTPDRNLASNIQNLDQGSVNQYIGAMPGMGQYADFLAQSSAQQLMAGRNLTAEEQRLADQAARSAYAARGTALGPQAVSAEILNRSDVANRRYQERLQNAAQAAGTIQAIYQPALAQSLQRQQAGIEYGMGQQKLLQSAQEQAYQQAMGREQLGAGIQQAAFQQALQRGQAEQQAYAAGTQAQAAQAALGAGAMSQLQAAQAPVLQAFYKQPILQGQEGQAQQMAMAMQQQSGPQFFNPESQTGMGSIYGAYNSQMNLAGAQAQANAAAKAGQMSMMGSLGGAAMGAGALMLLCWVAREVYGTENPRWTQFRDWMLNNASQDFIDAYIQHGPKIAEFISDKPELKNMIRSWMDSKIS